MYTIITVATIYMGLGIIRNIIGFIRWKIIWVCEKSIPRQITDFIISSIVFALFWPVIHDATNDENICC